MKRVLLIVIAGFAIVAGVVFARVLTEADAPPQKSVSNSEETAQLNQAFVRWVQQGQAMEGADEPTILATGYKVCEMDKETDYPDSVIMRAVDIMYPQSGQRVLDGARQYLCSQ
jgi:hypothetical protein